MWENGDTNNVTLLSAYSELYAWSVLEVRCIIYAPYDNVLYIRSKEEYIFSISFLFIHKQS